VKTGPRPIVAGWCGQPGRAVALAAILVAAWVGAGAATGDAPANRERLRLAFSARMLGDASRVDALAAIAAWGNSIAATRRVPITPSPMVFDSNADLLRALKGNEIDFVAMRMDEYLAMPPALVAGTCIVGRRNGLVTDRYLLVVRRTRAAAGLAGLKGTNLLLIDDGRGGLAPCWLEQVLSAGGQSPARLHFASVTPVTKISKTVLPVFFGQREAAVVTASGFATMAELNPQIGRDLAVMAQSEPLTVGIVILRDTFNPSLRDAVVEGVLALADDANGRQILRLFGYDSLEPMATGALDGARTLYAQQARQVARPADAR
jgi:hypothetical protein